MHDSEHHAQSRLAGIVHSGFQEFSGALECEGVGFKHSLSVFNSFFGIICLCVPALLILLIFYFKFEDRRTKWEKKPRIIRCVVWMTIGVFLTVFVLVVFELLFSLLYLIPEVVNHWDDWNVPQNGTTPCDKEVYLSSFSIITVSFVVVFIMLILLGVYIAKLYFQWVTDENDPGTLRTVIYGCLRRNEK